MHRRVPPLDIFGDLRYFQKKIENLKNSFSRTSLTWNGTKSWILVTLAHLARKWQTGLWRPGQICPPLFQIGLSIIYQGNICLQLDVRWYSSFSKDMLPQLATAEVLNYKKLTPLASKILHRILYRIIVLTPDRDSRSIKTYKTSTSCLQNTTQNTT